MNLSNFTANERGFNPLSRHAYHDIPLEGIAFTLTGLAAHLFQWSLAPPLIGIGLGLIAGKFVIKKLNQHKPMWTVELKKKAYKLVARFPKFQFLSLITTIAINILSQNVGFLLGFTLGCFSATIIDIDQYKQFQQTTRSK